MKEQVILMEKITGKTNRRYGGEGDIRVLAEDMKANGLINPITVTLPFGAPKSSDEFVIVAGRRRFAAAKLLGWSKIRANILDESEADKAEAIAGSENINRLAMHPLDEAAVFKKLVENGETVDSLAKQFDRTKSAIWQRVQLLDLGEGIKDLFRQGELSLHAAAMLKSLDAKQQEEFCKKFDKRPNKISDCEVEGFVAGARHDKLYRCVAGTECENCAKRTFFSDKTFFPELNDAEDSCLDHDCYMGKWGDLLAHRIKSARGGHKDHAGANIIVTRRGELRKILGKAVTLPDGVEYRVKAFAWDSVKKKAEKGAAPCFEAEMVNGKLTVSPLYWKEPAKKKAEAQKEKNVFSPVVKMLELPKDEAEQTAAALKAGCKDVWAENGKLNDISRKAREKVYARLLEYKANKKDDDREINRFLKDWLADDPDNSKNAKLFAGSDNIREIRKLSWPKLFTLLNARVYGQWSLPEIDKVAGEKQNKIADWVGISMAELKEMYREELRALLPKPKAAKPEG